MSVIKTNTDMQRGSGYDRHLWESLSHQLVTERGHLYQNTGTVLKTKSDCERKKNLYMQKTDLGIGILSNVQTTDKAKKRLVARHKVASFKEQKLQLESFFFRTAATLLTTAKIWTLVVF